jgi:diguanylate cyclase
MGDIPAFSDSLAAVPGQDAMTVPAHTHEDASGADRPAEDFGKLRDAIVMMVDDEPINIEVTQIYLEEAGYSRFVSTTDATQTLALLGARRPDVLLLDLMMPAMSGFDILREMRATNILKDVPTIVLTSSSDAETKLQALELGATDFLSKPVDPSELALRVRNTLAAKAYRDRLANYDLLTGLPNRRTFIDRLDWSLRHAQRYSKSGAVLHIDLDGFKQINEALGPAVGDQLLQAVAERIGKCVRTTDTLGRMEQEGPQPSLSRLAGDEFTVLLPALAQPDSAARVAQRVLEAIAEPILLSGHELRITCGIGIATFPEDGAEVDTIIRNAGVAMHHAKRQHKNSYQFYSSELNARALQRLDLGNQLRKGIERDELRLFYQPKNDVQTGRVCGAEALVRWQHPERGLIGPGEFIPLAEENGLIIPLGEWVLRAACLQSKAWQTAGLPALRISVNVSSHQFRQRRLGETLRGILGATGADPALLTVEITEGVLMENADANIKVLEDIKSMGVTLSMDDFGTGYSSLSYLNSFPLDELKVDRSFVKEIRLAGDHSAIIAAIIAMSHSLGLQVVAEGVETPHQLEFLKKQRCDEFQGFMVSKPVPAEEFAARFLAAADGD